MGKPIVQPRSNIPLVQTSDAEVLPASPFSRVVLSSVVTNWSNVVVEEHHFPGRELASGDLMHIQHFIAVNVGRSVTCEFKERRMDVFSACPITSAGFVCFLVMHTDLTVAEIAGAVNKGPHHFTQLFKQFTGRSPYRYVFEARTNKAREQTAGIGQVLH